MMSKLCPILMVLFSLPLFAANTQIWNSKNGHSFEGSYLSSDLQSVKLKGADSRVVTVPLAALDENSLQQVRAARAEAAENAPVFTHENPHLRYALYPKREWLQLEFLRGGKPLHAEPFVLKFDQAEVRNKRWTAMKIKGLAGDPVKTRDEVELRLEMSNGVIVRFFTATDRSEKMTFRYEIEPRPENLPKLHFRVRMDVPELLDYDIKKEAYTGSFQDTPLLFKDLPRALEGYEFVMRTEDETQRVCYHEKVHAKIKGVYAEIHHPEWPVLVLRSSGSSNSLVTRFYGGKIPASGYNLWFEGDEEMNPLLKAGPFSISAE